MSVAKHTETGETLVVYGGCGDGAKGIWARPYAMFCENVKCEYCDKECPRFTLVTSPPAEPCNCAEMIELAEKYDAYNVIQMLNILRGADDPEKMIQEMRLDEEQHASLFRNSVVEEGVQPKWKLPTDDELDAKCDIDAFGGDDYGGRAWPDHADPPRCLHNNCGACGGTGRRSDGSQCIHILPCPCPRCTP